MRNKPLYLEESMSFDPSPEDSLPELQAGSRRLKSGKLLQAALRVAINRELTARQRECVQLYFTERMTMEEIGRKLGVGKSTVHKHIKTAKERIRRVLDYAEALQTAMDEEIDE